MRIYLIISLLFCLASSTFSQNTLQYYLSHAEQNSPLLQKQSNNTEIINLDLKQFNAIYRSPNININSNVVFSPIVNKGLITNRLDWASSGSSNYVGYDLNATDGGIYQALVSVNQPLFTRKFTTVQQTKADMRHQQLANAVLLTKAELKQTVTHQYILCVLSQQQKKNIQTIIQLINEQIQQMTLLVKTGQYRVIDLKLLQIELSDKQIEKEQIEGICIENTNALNLLCGITNTAKVRFNNIDLELSATRDNPSMFASQFRLDSLLFVADKKQFDLQYLPQINAFADAGLNATYRPTFNRLGLSVGVSLKWNLFDGHQKQINNNRINFNLLNTNTDHQYFENQNDIRKHNLLQQIENLNKQIDLCNTQLTEYKKLLKMYKTEISEGLISVLELKMLTKEMSAKQQNITNLKMAKEILINAYNYWNL